MTGKILETLPHSVQEVRSSSTPKVGKIWILWTIWERRRFLAKVALRTLLVSTVLVFLIPNSFESTTSVLPSDLIPHTGGALSALAGLTSSSSSSSGLLDLASQAFGTKNTGAMYTALLRSRTVQENLVRRFGLMKVYHSRSIEAAQKALDKRTDIELDRKSSVITLTVTDHDRERARSLATGYIEELNNLLSHVTTSSAAQQRQFLERRLEQVKKDLETAETNFSQYASKNATLDVPEQTRAMVESSAMLEAQVIAAQSELEGLQEVYTPNNVRVRSAQARVAELQRKLQQMGGLPSKEGAKPSDSTDVELYPPIRQLPILGVQWANLYREVKVEELVFQLLTTQYELARMEEARESTVLNVVDAANLPEKKSFPPRLILMLSATLISVLFAALSIFAKDRWQRISYDDPAKLLIQSVGRSVSRTIRRIAGLLRWQKFRKSRIEQFPPES